MKDASAQSVRLLSLVIGLVLINALAAFAAARSFGTLQLLPAVREPGLTAVVPPRLHSEQVAQMR
jgi:hypothetical protein